LIALATSKAIRQTKPKGITKIGIIPQPTGTQVLLTRGASKMTRIARNETTTLTKKAKARYFSKVTEAEGLALLEERGLDLGLLAILLEYWLGWRKIDLGSERGRYANRTRKVL
jgi:hypothetical protein